MKRSCNLGEVALVVAENVRELRARRQLTVRGLSARMGELGHPILPTGICKIEGLDRRVDVSDLVALARALDVTPSRLLTPTEVVERQWADRQGAT